MKKGLFVLGVIFILLATCMDTHAETKYRYTTQKVKLAKDLTVKHNTKVLVIKSGKKKSLIEYRGEKYIVKTKYLHRKKAVNKYKGKSFKRVGHCRWNSCSWTWYTARRFPDRRNALGIKGKHRDKRGFICDKDGYICLASGRGNKKKHAIVPTPFGKFGKVYDTNGGYNDRWFDVWVSW